MFFLCFEFFSLFYAKDNHERISYQILDAWMKKFTWSKKSLSKHHWLWVLFWVHDMLFQFTVCFLQNFNTKIIIIPFFWILAYYKFFVMQPTSKQPCLNKKLVCSKSIFAKKYRFKSNENSLVKAFNLYTFSTSQIVNKKIVL